jgi:hypothetical protein
MQACPSRSSPSVLQDLPEEGKEREVGGLSHSASTQDVLRFVAALSGEMIDMADTVGQRELAAKLRAAAAEAEFVLSRLERG